MIVVIRTGADAFGVVARDKIDGVHPSGKVF
jgi:hypothetical protein